MCIKKLTINSHLGEESWKKVPELKLQNVGGSLLFNCNYDRKKLGLESSDDFYDRVIQYWESFCQTSPLTREDILNQIIWNNLDL